MCPSLKLCLFQNVNTKWDTLALSSSSNFEQWDNICQLLDEESLRFWKQWIALFVHDLDQNGTYFVDTVDYNSITKEFLNWETVTIEEKDEQDNTIESTIRIPAVPSISLQLYLHNVCSNLNQLIPYTLRKMVTAMLTEQLSAQLYTTYLRLSENEFVRNNQNASLQYYFDVKFVNLILIARDQKKMIENWQTLANSFKTNVDPFDFELIHKYLVNNVKRSTQRMQV